MDRFTFIFRKSHQNLWLFILGFIGFQITAFLLGWIFGSVPRSEFNVSINKERWPKVFCVVMTMPIQHNRAEAVMRSWGRHCDEILFFSSEEDDRFPVFKHDIHMDSREELWNKTHLAFSYLYENHLNDYDWFLKADDDTFFVIENLKSMLENYDPDTPIELGHVFDVPRGRYSSGGAGYVLSRGALKKFGTVGKTSDECQRKHGDEDLIMGKCLSDLNVVIKDASDKDHKLRISPLDLLIVMHNKMPVWAEMSENTIKAGRNCCSPYYISSHGPNEALTFAHYYLTYVAKVLGRSV